jgi:hypothetical protein
MIYLAEDLHHGTNSLDETEVGMKVKKIPLRDAIQMVHDGEITDSLTIIGLLQAQRHLNSH